MNKGYRRGVNLNIPKVEEILPDFYKRDYPKLIEFLKAYYETQTTGEGEGYSDLVNDLFETRDVQELDEYLFHFLMPEMTNGVDITSLLSDYRLKTNLLANYYRKKGSLFGFKEFFRWLLDENVEIEYTKENVFRIYDSNQPETADSKIGTKSFKYIKNDKLYQTFALLIKSGRPVSQWRDLYKEYCHPAGFYFEGSVVLEGEVDMHLSNMPLNVPVTFIALDPYEASAEVTITSSVTAIYDDSLLD